MIEITILYSAILAMLFIVLSVRVVMLRRKHGVGIGSNGQIELEKAIRAQANFAEYMPLAIILFLLAELTGTSSLILHFLGMTLVLGRLLHGWGLSKHRGISFGRFYGATLTFVAIIVLALGNLYSLLD